MSKPILYSYFRSSCSWRVRIALELKNVDYEYRAVHLVKGEQRTAEHRQLNPLGQVPAIVIDAGNGKTCTVTQSVAIMEYLEERYPEGQRLLPDNIERRAKVREIVEMINSGTQPIQNLSVMIKHSDDPAERSEWSRFWIEKGLRGVEAVLGNSAGKYCVGDEVTMADCCLIPQLYNASRFKVDMSQFPIINRVAKDLEEMPEFKRAHFSSQPDCPPELR